MEGEGITAIIELAKSVGEINSRLRTVESIIYNEEQEPVETSRMVYPVTGNIISEKPLTTEQYRMIKNSMCTVQVAGNFGGNGDVVVETSMTRDEFDDFLAKNPSKYGEYILKVTPDYDKYI